MGEKLKNRGRKGGDKIYPPPQKPLRSGDSSIPEWGKNH